MKKLIIVIAFAFLPCLSFAQNSKQDNIWKPMNFFVGQWKGIGESGFGKGEYERVCNYVLGNQFIEIKNKSTYPPTNKNPKGEVHEDIGYISYDKERKKFVLRQFHVESFVNTYVLESISADNKTIVFISEQIENISAGWRAKETYKIISDNEFVEIFELAEPNKDFFIYSQATFKRKSN